MTIFGSARLKPGSFGYEETKRVAAELARLGCDIVTGSGPGLMQAANEIWQGLVEWEREAMLSTDPPLASAKDLAIPKCVADRDAAIEILRRHQKSWQRQSLPSSVASRRRARAPSEAKPAPRR